MSTSHPHTQLLDASSELTRPPCHPIRGRANAGIFTFLDRYQHHLLGARKRALLADLPPTVVEFGSGTGASLRYLPPGSRLIAIEPNVHMHAALRRHAERRRVELEIHQESAERTSLPDASVDVVICTLVLCTVPDPGAAIAEARRILRPGGRFIFIEHVRADPRPLRRLQRIVAPPWRYVFEGCELDRDTAGILATAGFADLRIDHFRLGGLFVPIWPQICGTATA
jgi:SAM-dependent methyltransferase